MVASLSSSDGTVIPEATRVLDESPENAPRHESPFLLPKCNIFLQSTIVVRNAELLLI